MTQNLCKMLALQLYTMGNLVLNIHKTKELIVDFRHARSHNHVSIYINGAVVERVSSFNFLGVPVLLHPDQHLYFLRSIEKAHPWPRILTDFYRCTIESLLTNCISGWYGNCPVLDCKALQNVVKTAQRIIGTQLPTTENIYYKSCLGRAKSIIKDASHPNHGLFTLLPSCRRYRSFCSCTSRHRKSFFPEAVPLLNLTSQC
ncbi:uncharacterized protein LOC132399811 isoform X2 [Hypanus sabinus]|uniref:uncharacterized protein LOC132399811 isoform X2 n=1 Tax=Hypanus sabinus TaxID=79690 RepID=UPI0028C47194|nr:uncharacterized protein LOC132399811 isoform X2 [Hypanus sabinus]